MKPSPPTRRDVLAAALATSAVAGLAGGCQGTQRKGAPRSQSQRGPIAGCEPIPHVRLGMIGVGDRGSTHVRLINRMADAEIVAVAEPHGPAAEAAVAACRAAGKPEPVVYGNGEHDYRNLLERGDVDVVLISTPWRWHEPQAVEAMRAGKHALVEVPLALTIDALWSVVETCEATGRHCMMLENVNYGRDELLTLNLCRQGVFGDLLHAEAAYIHDLRSQMHDVGWGTGSWRTAYHAREHGNLYPTHGLGPVAHCMNLDRTEDRFDSLVSMGSPARGRNVYAAEHLPADHPPGRVLIAVITDGGENASSKYTAAQVSERIAACKTNHGWQFVFIGTEQAAITDAAGWGVDRESSIQFSADRADSVQGSWKALSGLSSRIRDLEEKPPSGFTDEEREGAGGSESGPL